MVAVPTLGWPELLLVLAVLLLLFGARKLPDIARSMGKSTNEFKKGLREGREEPAAAETPPPSEPSAGDRPTAGP
jgi:sec-independent protein translocase protein TatA